MVLALILLGIVLAGVAAFMAFAVVAVLAAIFDDGPWVPIFVLLVAVPAVAGPLLAGGVTHEGEAVGYVSAVERGGVLFRTTHLYFKPDLASTQKDEYCVEDAAVTAALEQAARAKVRVRLSFTTHLFFDDGCAFDDSSVVRAVQVAQQGLPLQGA